MPRLSGIIDGSTGANTESPLILLNGTLLWQKFKPSSSNFINSRFINFFVFLALSKPTYKPY